MSIKLPSKILKHRFILVLLILLVIIGGYFGYQKLTNDGEIIRYVTAAVERGTLIASVEGSGQVSVSDEVNIEFKVKGDVVRVYVLKGEKIEAGDLIAELDSADYEQAVEESEISLEMEKLKLEELINSTDELTLLKAQNAVLEAENSLERLKLNQEKEYQKALESVENTEKDIEEAYEDSLNAVTNAFLELPTLIIEIEDILYSDEIAKSGWGMSGCQTNSCAYKNYFYVDSKIIKEAEEGYELVQANYDENFENYKNANRYSEKETIDALLNETIETTKSLTEVIKAEITFINFIIDYFTKNDWPVCDKITNYQSDLKNYNSKTNTLLSNLSSIQRSLEDSRDAKLEAEENLRDVKKTQPLDLQEAEITLKEKKENLAEITEGADELEVRAKRIAIRQKEEALLTAKQNLIDCRIFSPIDGIVAEIEVEKGDSVSLGFAMATIISEQKIAEITLNELDIAKVELGQLATLTLDAIDGLTLTGKIIEVDSLGSVNQGVVTYDVKISLDAQKDERLKSGMSLSVSIITDSKQNALVISSSAIKQQGDINYVQLIDGSSVGSDLAAANVSGAAVPDSSLKIQQIQIGLSNDTMTEIIDGLEEGDIVVIQTINSGSTPSQSSSNFGGSGEMQDMIRMMR